MLAAENSHCPTMLDQNNRDFKNTCLSNQQKNGQKHLYRPSNSGNKRWSEAKAGKSAKTCSN